MNTFKQNHQKLLCQQTIPQNKTEAVIDQELDSWGAPSGHQAFCKPPAFAACLGLWGQLGCQALGKQNNFLRILLVASCSPGMDKPDLTILRVYLPGSPGAINKSKLLSPLYAPLPSQLLQGFRRSILKFALESEKTIKNTPVPEGYGSIFALVSPLCVIVRNLCGSSLSASSQTLVFFSANIQNKAADGMWRG